MPSIAIRAFCLAACFLAVAVSAEPLEVKTPDGMVLHFQPDQIHHVAVAKAKDLPTINGGFSIRDAKAKTATFVRGQFTKESAVHFAGSAEDFEISADFSSHHDYIAVDGIVRNHSAQKERCADLKFALPLDCAGWQWGSDLNSETAIEKTVFGQKTSDGVTIYPLAAVSSTNLGAGIAIAVPPMFPTLFETGAGSGGLFIILKLGFSSATVPAEETAFHFIIYRHDPGWGFRSALERYYTFYRDPYFTRRVKKIGAWGWHHPSPSELPNADLYAYHESGGETWQIKDQGMHGYEHEGINLATNVADFVRLTRVAQDEKLGIYSLPYTMVGQRQIYRLPKLPATRDEALTAFTNWTASEPLVFQAPGPSVSFTTVAQLKEIIRNSCVYDKQQKPDVLIRDYLGNTVTFPLNPNPNLFSGTTNLTIAKYTLNEYLPMLFAGSKMIDGCYVDSLGRWPGYYNLRKEHFRYTTLPLTCMGGVPAIWNLQSHAEYLAELSKRLHAQNRIVFANGVHPNRVMLGFYVDVLGEEGVPDFSKGGFYSKRVAAFDKPFCALNGRDNTNPRVWNSCLYLGILIGARSKEGQQMERKFLPSIIRLNEAGWRPVTLATSESSDVVIERWGDGGEKPFFFSLLNRSKAKVETTIHVSPLLTDEKKLSGKNLLTGKSVPIMQREASADFAVSLPPETATAIALTPVE